MTIEAQLLERVSALLGRRDLTQQEIQAWWAGAADGGPNGDGLYPATDSTGYVRLLPSPAKLIALFTGGGTLPPTPIAAKHIAPNGAGNWSGDSWENAAPLHALNSMIAEAAAIGGDVLLRADAGPYALPATTITLTKGGSVASPVRVRGVDASGQPMRAQFVGSRASPWIRGAATGGENFWLNAGASNLSFEDIDFVNGGTCIRLREANSNLRFENMKGSNVRRLIQNGAASGQTASISGITIRNLEGRGFSKQFVILRYDSSNILVEDCYLDAERQDGDNWSGGVVFDDTAHGIIVRRVSVLNCYMDNGTAYWNADAFTAERGQYDFLMEDCYAFGCTDGGYDIKGTVVMVRCIAEECKRGFRMWGQATLIDCIGKNPVSYGGSGSSGHVYGYNKSRVLVKGGTWTQNNNVVPFHTFESGFVAVDQAAQNATTKPAAVAMFTTEGGEDALIGTLDYADKVAPALTGAIDYEALPPNDPAYPKTYPLSGGALVIEKDENQPASFLLTASERVTLEISGVSASKFSLVGRRLLMNAQDADVAQGAAGDGTNTLKVSVTAVDANDNRSPPTQVQVIVRNVDDRPIAPAEAFSYADARGFWFDIADSTDAYADVGMSIPAVVGEEVAAVRDRSGFGLHLTQPDVDARPLLRFDGLNHYLDFDGVRKFMRLGQPGDLRYPQFTAFSAFYRPRDAGDEKGYLMFSGRRSTSASSSTNGSFWLAVGDTSFASWRRSGGDTTGIDGGAPRTRASMLSLRNSDGVLRYNGGKLFSDSADNAGNSYSLAAEQPLVGCRFDGSGNLGFFSGRIYALAMLNASVSDDVRFRIERQLAASAGLGL